ncbi:glycosyltransferase family 39 protein [Prosthecobacter sp. SYSU 5D2]
MTSLPDPASDALWTRRFAGLLGVVFLFRIAFMLFFTAQADLAGDEAYYWDWGRQPDWGYFSKPPMIGWLMGLVGWATGNAEWGVRLAPLLFGTATLAVLFALARQLFGAATAYVAALLILLTPANMGLNLFFTIDAPLLLFWSLALLLFWLAVEKPACLWRWGALALTIGLGTLSKQMMLAFPAMMAAFAIFSPPDRHLLRNPRMWASILIGMAFITPVLWWNTQHEWITLEHTKHHFETQSLSFTKWLSRTLEFPAVQTLVYSPVTYVALLVVLYLGAKNWRLMDRRARYLLLCSAPALLGFFALSLRQKINPNWPAVFYVPAFILLAAWFAGQLPFIARPFWRTWTVRVGAGLVILAHIALLVIFLTDLKGHKKLNEMRGWTETGIQAGEFLDRVPRPENTFVLATGYRYDAAQLAFTMPQHPRTYRWERSGRVLSQYEVWPGPEERLGDDALIFKGGDAEPAALFPAVAKRFEKVERLGRVEVTLGPNNKRIFDVFLGHNLLSWEKPGRGDKK